MQANMHAARRLTAKSGCSNVAPTWHSTPELWVSLAWATTSQGWVMRSSNAVFILGGAEDGRPSPKARLVVTTTEVRS